MTQTQVIVNQKFTLTKGHGQAVTYKPGKYPIPNEDANHWWAQQFITILPNEDEPEIEDPIIQEDAPIIKRKNKKASL